MTIFPVLFYHEGAHGAQNAFIDGISESMFTDRNWEGMACEMESIGDCIVKPSQFGIDIFPAYVFLRRLDSDPEDAVMVKKIEGRELTKSELIAEIADAAAAEFEDDGSGIIDIDGDGNSDVVQLPPSKYGLLGLAAPLNRLFDCNTFFPSWVCRMKLGYLVLLVLLVVVLVAFMKKIH